MHFLKAVGACVHAESELEITVHRATFASRNTHVAWILLTLADLTSIIVVLQSIGTS